MLALVGRQVTEDRSWANDDPVDQGRTRNELVRTELDSWQPV